VKAVGFLRATWSGAALALIGTGLLTAGLAPFGSRVGLLNEGLLFLLLTVAVSAVWGRWPGVFAALITNLALNYFFVEPLHRFQVAGLRNLFGLLIFLIVSLVASSLLSAAREAAAQAKRRQAETDVLLSLNRALTGQTDPAGALGALCSQAVRAFRVRGVSVLSRASDGWTVICSAGAPEALRLASSEERSMANLALESGAIQAAGWHRAGRRPSRVVSGLVEGKRRGQSVVFAPLSIGGEAKGVLRLDGPAESRPGDDLLKAFSSEAALCVQRLELASAAAESAALKEADEVKTALMLSISHDLKTPLASIKTSVTSLLDRSVNWPEEDRVAFLETIESQADYLNRAISDVLDLNRIESGAVRPLLRRVRLRDVIEDGVERTGRALEGHIVEIVGEGDLEADLDASLVGQAVSNLLDNAAKYSRPGSPIRVTLAESDGNADVAIEDQGPGIDAGDLTLVFEKFYRARRTGARVEGTGLGLALVKGFVTLSGGAVRVESSGHGASFILSFPLRSRNRVPA
jgi:two-component system sensor histidine kinase KdpD